MKWCTRVILVVPFAVAALLTLLTEIRHALHLRTEHIEGFGFLFATPWAWLLDHDWYFGAHPAPWIATTVTYAVILWVPAVMYSLALWLLMCCGRWARKQLSA